jgi:uncharacterized protein YeaO (DUF488 family)
MKITGRQMMARQAEVRVRRVYDDRQASDGTRVLVDRIWPRGMTKSRADLDVWCKTVAPSAALRKWYGHDPERFREFAHRYRAELDEPEAAAGLAAKGPVTLLTATRYPEISEAAVLSELMRT